MTAPQQTKFPRSPLVATPARGVSLVAYTDGGCRGNPGIGAWGMVLVHVLSGTTLERAGGTLETTNNRMEISGAIEVLQTLQKPGCHIEIRTDSKLLVQTATQWMAGWKKRGWKKADKKTPSNLDLIKQLDQLCQQHHITWTWVRGHAGEPGNERVDTLCNEAMDRIQAGGDPAAEYRPDRAPFGFQGA